jgi:hypothetical protein
MVLVGKNLGDQVTEAHRLTPPHTSGLGSWLSTSGCGSATCKADAEAGHHRGDDDPLRGTGNNGPVSTAMASNFLNGPGVDCPRALRHQASKGPGGGSMLSGGRSGHRPMRLRPSIGQAVTRVLR